ncbi:efflux RND transporter periplasmic adaptor subunit [Bacillus infantis]|uniref:efflux RND transporter periplasmic adaptor subunit n=1 Tax=Bacillus infantis TaxID=324767 RepID=UPI0021553D5F|nr:efflux RND transporter periplasmic adaptor subunit [Bacillus infantis]MCR6612786.1 efflux RND transporter periplasmic adaptor subunit [Bacillus infantis]
MKTWKKQTIAIISVLFTAGNLFLITKDKSKIERIEKIDHWQRAETGYIKNTLETSGVAIPAEEQKIFFDQNSGSFTQFLVKTGQEVSPGTPLFEYSPYNEESEIERLEAKQNELSDKAASVSAAISQLQSLLMQARSEATLEEPNTAVIYDLEKEISQKELEEDLLESESSSIDSQIDALESRSVPITVNSSTEGYVKEIKDDLENPVVTISSTSLSVEGSLNEAEALEVKEGMEASILGPSIKKELEGQILEVSPAPENEPDTDLESIYPYVVQLSEPAAEELLSGTHVSIEVLLQEAENAILVPVKSVHKGKKKEQNFVLTDAGRVDHRQVELGMREDKKQEILSGLEENEIIASRAKDVEYKNGSPFRTPLKLEKLSKTSLKTTIKDDWGYILRGFFSKY